MTGFVLAGGASSRMGQDKALLTVGSRTLIEVVMERIQSLVDQVVVIGSPRNAQRLQDRLAPHAWLRQAKPGGLACRILTDLKPGCGPLMGVYTGLMATETPLNLFVPCDMPWVEGQVIERLARACREGADVAASLHPLQGLQPFPLVCHARACRIIGALLDAGERSLQALLRGPRTQVIEIQEPELWRSFTNINTVSDYAKLSHETTVTPRP